MLRLCQRWYDRVLRRRGDEAMASRPRLVASAPPEHNWASCDITGNFAISAAPPTTYGPHPVHRKCAPRARADTSGRSGYHRSYPGRHAFATLDPEHFEAHSPHET